MSHPRPSREWSALTAVLLAATAATLWLRPELVVTSKRAQARPLNVAREMRARGDYVVPTESGRPRFQKPPLPYWLVCAAAWLTGGTVDDLAGCLPSLLVATALLGLAGAWAGQLAGAAAGTGRDPPATGAAPAAALVLLCVPMFHDKARSSEAEIQLALWVTAAAFLLWRAARAPAPAVRSLAGAYLCIGLGFLVKGPLALLMPLPAYLIVRGRALHREWHWHAAGIALALFPTAAWALLCIHRNPHALTVFYDELIRHRTGAATVHPGPFYYYLPVLVAQWHLFLPFAALGLRTLWRAGGPGRYLPWFLLLNLLGLSCLGTKQEHYLVPLLPVLAVATGASLPALAAQRSELRWLLRGAAALAGVAALLSTALLWPESLPGLTVAGSAAVAIWLCRQAVPRPALWFAALAAVFLFHARELFQECSAQRLLAPRLMGRWLQRRGIEAAAIARVGDDDELALYWIGTPRLRLSADEAATTTERLLLSDNEPELEALIADPRFQIVHQVRKHGAADRLPEIALFARDPLPAPLAHATVLLLPPRHAVLALAGGPLPRDTDAIVPAVDPLGRFTPWNVGRRARWNRLWLPALTDGIELAAFLDPQRDPAFQRLWFHDSPMWGLETGPLWCRIYPGGHRLWVGRDDRLPEWLPRLRAECAEPARGARLLLVQGARPGEEPRADPALAELEAAGLLLLNRRLPPRATEAARLHFRPGTVHLALPGSGPTPLWPPSP